MNTAGPGGRRRRGWARRCRGHRRRRQPGRPQAPPRRRRPAHAGHPADHRRRRHGGAARRRRRRRSPPTTGCGSRARRSSPRRAARRAHRRARARLRARPAHLALPAPVPGRTLAEPPTVRQVIYDQRSHGRSERAPRASCTIDQLGHDLAAVIRALAPDGPLVLVGPLDGRHDDHGAGRAAAGAVRRAGARRRLPRTSAGEVGEPRAARHLAVAAQPAHPRGRPGRRLQPTARRGRPAGRGTT